MDATQLVQDALIALGPYGDPRAREALVHATVTLEPDVRRWTASEGTVHGHRVRVYVDARTLGVVRAHPAVEDALQTAFARAIAAFPGQSLVDFVIEWNGVVVTQLTTYRGEVLRSDTNDLAGALVAYLEGAGEREVARRLAALDVARVGDAVVIAGAVDGPTLAVLRGATKALLGERVRVTSC
jgi:hypothetical protein